MEKFDVVIVGASFGGLTLAHYLPQHFKVLIIDKKRQPDSVDEPTGLTPQVTRERFAVFIDVYAYIAQSVLTGL